MTCILLRAGYGEQILSKLSHDLTARFGRGFGRRNLFQIRAFYLAYRSIVQTLSAQSGTGVRAALLLESDPVKSQTLSAESQTEKSATASRKSRISESLIRTSPLSNLASAFPLPWSHYVRLLSLKSALAREFYHTEALRGGWSVRQLDRQIAFGYRLLGAQGLSGYQFIVISYLLMVIWENLKI